MRSRCLAGSSSPVSTSARAGATWPRTRAPRIHDRQNAFLDLHFGYALARAGDDAAVGRLLGGVARHAARSASPLWREVALAGAARRGRARARPVASRRRCTWPRPRPALHLLGGSTAQQAWFQRMRADGRAARTRRLHRRRWSRPHDRRGEPRRAVGAAEHARAGPHARPRRAGRAHRGAAPRSCRGAGPGGADIGYLVAGDPRRPACAAGARHARLGRGLDRLPAGAAARRRGAGARPARLRPQRAAARGDEPGRAGRGGGRAAAARRPTRRCWSATRSAGAIAARVAAEQPRRVGALVLLAASLDPRLETVHALQRVAAWPLLRALLPRAIRNANAELIALRDELLELAGAARPHPRAGADRARRCRCTRAGGQRGLSRGRG